MKKAIPEIMGLERSMERLCFGLPTDEVCRLALGMIVAATMGATDSRNQAVLLAEQRLHEMIDNVEEAYDRIKQAGA